MWNIRVESPANFPLIENTAMTLTCLIAAHDPWFIQLLRAYAHESGFRVVQAFEGQDVLPMVHLEHPAAVFLQAELPGKIVGKDIIKKIRADSEIKDTLVLVFYSQLSTFEDEMDDCEAIHLQEPVNYETFENILQDTGLMKLISNSSGS